MIQTFRLSDFTNAFRNSDRADQFSYEGLTLLFDYFEECDSQMEFDMIAICCEWAEDTPENIAAAYDIELKDYKELSQEVISFLEYHTSVAGVTDAGTIVYCSSF
jgi:hypothetical protein